MSKTILVTGTSSGFGRATATLLAAQGHRVFAAMRDTESRNRAAAEAFRADGIGVVELDVTSEASVDRAVAEIVAQAGGIDVLVNNAGIVGSGVVEAFSIAQAQAMFDVNVLGVLRGTRAVLPHMRRAGQGLIVSVGSVVGRVTFPFFGIYGATKFALEALADSLRYELAPLGVEISLVQPNAYPTNIFAAALVPEDAARAAEYGKVAPYQEAMGKAFEARLTGPSAGDPNDVARAIAEIIAAPRGARPERVVVGDAPPAVAVNEAVAPIQRQLIEALGLGDLAKLAA